MKLFHCIVVMGAAIGASCGSREADLAGNPGHTSDASTETSTSPPRDDGGCAYNGFTPGCFYNGSCRGTPSAPLGPADCAHAQQLQCDPAGGCTCNPTAPLTAFDCPATQQFFCEDWGATPPCGCTCNLHAPLGPADCCSSPRPDASSSADAATPADGAAGTPCGEIWTCSWYDPPINCSCSVPIL